MLSCDRTSYNNPSYEFLCITLLSVIPEACFLDCLPWQSVRWEKAALFLFPAHPQAARQSFHNTLFQLSITNLLIPAQNSAPKHP